MKQIDDYLAAWNKPQTEQQRALLERSVTGADRHVSIPASSASIPCERPQVG